MAPIETSFDPPTGRASEAEVLGKSVARTASLFELSNAQLGRILGLSEASTSRLRNGQGQVLGNGKARELALLLIRLFRGVYAIAGGDAATIRSWLRSPNDALRGRPIELIETVTGLTAAVMYVDSRRARI